MYEKMQKSLLFIKHIKNVTKISRIFYVKMLGQQNIYKCYQNFTDYLRAIVRSIKNIKSLTEISRIIYVEQNILADKIY